MKRIYPMKKFHFEELQAMYDKRLDSIETLDESGIQNTFENQGTPCISLITEQSDDKIIWTFNTGGALEHITNNKNILTNF